MHDLLAAKEILGIVEQWAQKNNFKKITKIVIEIGRKKYTHNNHEDFEEINPENLEYNLKIISKNTTANNAEIIINKSNHSDIIVKEVEGEG